MICTCIDVVFNILTVPGGDDFDMDQLQGEDFNEDQDGGNQELMPADGGPPDGGDSGDDGSGDDDEEVYSAAVFLLQ